MNRRILAGAAFFMAIVCCMNIGSAADKKVEKKPDPKKPEPKKTEDKKPTKLVATDPAKAGPDYPIQGEYLGETADKSKWGAEVIARGNGNFVVNFLPGGLRVDGGDYAKHIDGFAKTDGGKTVVASKDTSWVGAIADGKMTGTAGDKSFTLKHTVRTSPTMGAKPPSEAVVLFDGKGADDFVKAHLEAGNLVGTDIPSKTKFKDHTLHLEFRLSFMPFDGGLGRSNSGVYLQQRYEVQVLDSFGLKGENNECGGIYTKVKPLVNMCYPPLTWQTYDIEFTAAKYDGSKKTTSARATVKHNGVLIHDNVEINGSTGGGQAEMDTPGPLFLQGHGGQVQYRNIWAVEKK